jgi:hypothetical protein
LNHNPLTFVRGKYGLITETPYLKTESGVFTF